MIFAIKYTLILETYLKNSLIKRLGKKSKYITHLVENVNQKLLVDLLFTETYLLFTRF